jgi:hypothetical protein
MFVAFLTSIFSIGHGIVCITFCFVIQMSLLLIGIHSCILSELLHDFLFVGIRVKIKFSLFGLYISSAVLLQIFSLTILFHLVILKQISPVPVILIFIFQRSFAKPTFICGYMVLSTPIIVLSRFMIAYFSYHFNFSAYSVVVSLILFSLLSGFHSVPYSVHSVHHPSILSLNASKIPTNTGPCAFLNHILISNAFSHKFFIQHFIAFIHGEDIVFVSNSNACPFVSTHSQLSTVRCKFVLSISSSRLFDICVVVLFCAVCICCINDGVL